MLPFGVLFRSPSSLTGILSPEFASSSRSLDIPRALLYGDSILLFHPQYQKLPGVFYMAEMFSFLFYRGIERWMVVLGGIIFGYLGYKLFLYGVDQGHGKLNAENQFFKITFSGSGPGLFFMAFGALILMASMYSTGSLSHKSQTGNADQTSTNAAAKSVEHSTTAETTLQFASKVGASECDLIRLSAHDSVRDALEAYGNVENEPLNQLATAMSSISDDKLQSLLPAVETILCE